MEELIERSSMRNLYACLNPEDKVLVGQVVIDIESVPAVEPWDLYDCDEWCTDCKEYDTENHRCPRWNRVIRKTLGENIVIDPETVERGSETYIGEDIVVCHHEDYMDMMCKAMMWDEYGEEPKQGEWIRTFDGNEWFWYCSNCKQQWYEDDLWMGGNEFPHFCPDCGARMKGANDDSNNI